MLITALITILILIMDQVTMCNLKGVAHSDEPTENALSSVACFSSQLIVVLSERQRSKLLSMEFLSIQ